MTPNASDEMGKLPHDTPHECGGFLLLMELSYIRLQNARIKTTQGQACGGKFKAGIPSCRMLSSTPAAFVRNERFTFLAGKCTSPATSTAGTALTRVRCFHV
jgi:hypothetical protein